MKNVKWILLDDCDGFWYSGVLGLLYALSDNASEFINIYGYLNQKNMVNTFNQFIKTKVYIYFNIKVS